MANSSAFRFPNHKVTRMLKTAPILLAMLHISAQIAFAEPPNRPRVLIADAKLELIAAEPEIVTPVGMCFDQSGRLLVIESHTHKRQEDYPGRKHDRIRSYSDTDADGKLDTWGVFSEGYTHALNLLAHPSGDIYLVTRADVRILKDNDGDGKADSESIITRLETEQTYPHNGLGGICLQPDGESIYLGLGENFGSPYLLVGSDDRKFSGRPGVGMVFEMQADGSQIQPLATGFWNPFGLGLAGDELFALDNDPDAAPPCRLIHVLPAGDYGFRFQYGRAGTHPLQAWDGELVGTLGMVAGTGEAPCTVLWHRGYLYVSSWGEHRVERFQLTPTDEGTYTAKREVVVQGESEFRPTGMAIAPDGSLWLSDWVSRSYPVHGAGRVWRLTLPELASNHAIAPTTTGPIKTRQKRILELARFNANPAVSLSSYEDAEELLALMEAYTFSATPVGQANLNSAIAAEDPNVRLMAIRWICDQHPATEPMPDGFVKPDYLPQLERLLDGDIPNERYYKAVLAAIDWLRNPTKMRHSGITDGLLARELRNGRRSDEAKSLALRLISPDHKLLTEKKIRDYVGSEHDPLKREAVRTLTLQSSPERFTFLSEIAIDRQQDNSIRADAVAGLAGDAIAQKDLLETLASEDSIEVAHEAERVLRLAKLKPVEQEPKPAADQIEAWLPILSQNDGSAESGGRLFYSSVGARCAVCHQHRGRGGRIGPDLTHVGTRLSRKRLVESILQPSREIAPRYEPWLLETDDGRVLIGLRLHQGGDSGEERYADANGNSFKLRSEEIESRQVSKTSLMPSGLEQTVSVQDLRDLLAFLSDKQN